jgi:hypothetical protein
VPASEVPGLEEERRFFERERGRLLAEHEGRFALVHRSELLGLFGTLETAYDAGLERLGNLPMLIARIRSSEPLEYLSPALEQRLLDALPYP